MPTPAELFGSTPEAKIALASGSPDRMVLGNTLLFVLDPTRQSATAPEDWLYIQGQITKAAIEAEKQYSGVFASNRSTNARKFYSQPQVKLIFTTLESFTKVNPNHTNVTSVANLERHKVTPETIQLAENLINEVFFAQK